MRLRSSPDRRSAQTQITPPKNKFTPEQDVQLGQEAAAEVRKAYPIITNDAIDSFVDRIGERLVAAAPANLNNPVFQYEFTPVNVKEINAFALPGGPMFINRGMIESAHTEGEVAGVMAHELAHVLLRHGTANATKAQKFQIGALAGAIAGAIVGGGLGQVISQGSQFGLGTWMLKYSREYEQQADILGVQMMARAGYDPRDLARVFETIEKQGGSGAPQWMSDHPNPGNRSAYIAQEARMVRVANARNDNGDLQRVKQALSSSAARQVDGRRGADGQSRRRRRRGPGVGRPHRRPGAARRPRPTAACAAAICSRRACRRTGRRSRRPTASSSCRRTGWATTTARACSPMASRSASRAPRRAI